ncbi:hydroxymethylglutaryl-CoA lyase [Roseomonas populi]|uniref:Hydroxymethylglutaryl-CoA lyase n=1 Tax=Roseomonas populi TaxID=3121582 RepID=A0ABT1WZ29_9PROT|nr:hydroxymethylglutaryl-CoA lyase [Roseomonas pecuniae]MCR0980791.1 hydroxymethylglutaryl-CoA lyase [Roseomonas pecuniae]
MSSTSPMADVVICECFARDGLQHETQEIAAAEKVRLIDGFAAIGFPRVEATSYSNPKVVPQFADASEVLRALPRRDGVFYKASCANPRAVERALADHVLGFGANEVSFLVSASESHSRRNLNRDRAAQWQNVAEMAREAGDAFRTIGTISVAFGCPFEGPVDPDSVLRDVGAFLENGITRIALGDTTGMATPRTVETMVRRIGDTFPEACLIAHFHDSRGTGLLNCAAACGAGVRWFDSSFGGVGGHPSKVSYGGGYTGNVCTEDLVNLFESMGIRTGIDLGRLVATATDCEEALGRPLLGRVTRTGLNPLIPGATADAVGAAAG